MNKAKTYRCRRTGKTLTSKDIPERVHVTRYLPPKVKQHNKWVQPKIFYISPPANEKNYDDYLFDVADIDPIQPVEPPEFNKLYQVLVPVEAVLIRKKWHQAYEVRERFENLAEKRLAAVTWVKRLANIKRDSGIVVGGIPVRTDTTGIARLSAAVLGGALKIDYVVDDKTWQLTNTQLVELLAKVDKHIQATYTERAKLTEEIKTSRQPFSLDVSSLK